jgi:hypothetical protein
MLALIVVFLLGVLLAEHVRTLAARVADTLTHDLPATSIYDLNVSVDGTNPALYCAGEYLVRDNGAWRNVYLTGFARGLMGINANIRVLNPATLHTSDSVIRTWHVAIA